MIESLDCVQKGDFLVCSRGPVARKKGEYGKKEYDAGPEGLLVRVLAVSPPMFLARYFPFPMAGEDAECGVTCYTWGRMGWSKASKRYVKEYLRESGKRADGTPVKPRQTVERKVALFKRGKGD